MPSETLFDLKFTSHEVCAWGGLALLKRMLDGMNFTQASVAMAPPEFALDSDLIYTTRPHEK